MATAALAVAVATVISIGLMIGSFRDGLEQWIDNTLTADFYVLLNGRQADRGRAEAWAQAIAVLPEVAAISRTVRVSLPGVDGDIGLRAYEEGPSGWGLDLVAGAAVEWEQRFRTGDGIVLAEPYAYRQALRVGDSLRLPTPAGPNEFDIVAIARDYNTAGSAVIMSFDGFRQYWPAPTVSGLGVHLAPDADASSAGAAIEDARPTQLNAIVRSTRAIRTLSLTLFDRTFEITSVLRALAGIVAFFGVLSAVLALQLERRAEFSVLRAVGMSMSELKQHVIIQTMLLGLAAATAAIPLGIALAWLLILVINRRAFGWSMEFVASGEPLSYGVALAILGAGLSGLAAAAIGFRSRSAESFRG